RARNLAAELFRLERDGAAVLPQNPRRELGEGGEIGDEHAVFETAGVAVGALYPPRGVAAHLDACLADRLADLPGRASAKLLDIEIGGRAKVALAACCELDLSADARHAERADACAVEVLSDHVPAAVVLQEGIRVERALGDLVAGGGPVFEARRALLRDRAFELREAAGHLGRVVGIDDLDALRGVAGRLREAGSAQREVLEREPQRLGVRELSLE